MTKKTANKELKLEEQRKEDFISTTERKVKLKRYGINTTFGDNWQLVTTYLQDQGE